MVRDGDDGDDGDDDDDDDDDIVLYCTIPVACALPMRGMVVCTRVCMCVRYAG